MRKRKITLDEAIRRLEFAEHKIATQIEEIKALKAALDKISPGLDELNAAMDANLISMALAHGEGMEDNEGRKYCPVTLKYPAPSIQLLKDYSYTIAHEGDDYVITVVEGGSNGTS